MTGTSPLWCGLAIAALLVACSNRTEQPSSVTADDAIAVMAGPYLDGDLIFRRGRDLMSDVVLAQGTGSRFSHVGLVVVVDDRAWVVHAMPAGHDMLDGVRREPMKDFLSGAITRDAAVFRLTDLDAVARTRLRDHALAQQGRPFDFAFELSTPDRLYCSELVITALRAAGWDRGFPSRRVALLGEPVVTPDDLLQLQGLVRVAGG